MLFLMFICLALLAFAWAMICLLLRKPRVAAVVGAVTVGLVGTAFLSWEPIYKTRTPRFANAVKKVADPQQLQQWALAVIRDKEKAAALSDEIPLDAVPASIRNLRGWPIQYARCYAGHAQDPSVWLVWGGGFGHWGMRVGSPAFKIVPEPDDNYYIEWQPGIYFWHETH